MKENAFPWRIVLASMAILGGSQGVVINTNGIILAAIVRDMGFRAGDFSVFYTIMYLVSALSVTFTSRMFFTKNSKTVMALQGTLFTVPFAAMSLYSRLWHWYVAAAFCGFGYSCMMVVVTTTLNNWFAARKGLVAGVTLSVSGVLGAVLAPVFARCVVSFGWRATAALTGSIAFAMIVLFGAFALTPSPEREGRRPWGESVSAQEQGAERPRQTPRYAFFLCLIALACLNSMFQFNLQLPLFARTFGYSLAAGAALTSCSMIGNITGKVVLGFAVDRLGAYRAGVLLALSLASSFALFWALPRFFAALCLAGVLFGVCYSVGGVLLPQLSLALWGRDAYRPFVSRLAAFNAIAAAVTGSAFPYLHDFTGGWTAVLWLNMGLCSVAALIFAFFASRASKWNAD